MSSRNVPTNYELCQSGLNAVESLADACTVEELYALCLHLQEARERLLNDAWYRELAEES